MPIPLESDIALPISPEDFPLPESPVPEEEDDEEIKDAVLDLIQDYERDDKSAHEQISMECRKYELYWQGIQDLIWDSSSRDWVSASGILQTSRDLDGDPSMLDKVIGIYRS